MPACRTGNPAKGLIHDHGLGLWSHHCPQGPHLPPEIPRAPPFSLHQCCHISNLEGSNLQPPPYPITHSHIIHKCHIPHTCHMHPYIHHNTYVMHMAHIHAHTFAHTTNMYTDNKRGCLKWPSFGQTGIFYFIILPIYLYSRKQQA